MRFASQAMKLKLMFSAMLTEINRQNNNLFKTKQKPREFSAVCVALLAVAWLLKLEVE